MAKQGTTRILLKAKNILMNKGDEIKKKYNVSQMGIGFKTENGKLTNRVAIVFYVETKKSKDKILSEGGNPIPEEIEGIPTDIVEISGGFRPR